MGVRVAGVCAASLRGPGHRMAHAQAKVSNDGMTATRAQSSSHARLAPRASNDRRAWRARRGPGAPGAQLVRLALRASDDQQNEGHGGQAHEGAQLQPCTPCAAGERDWHSSNHARPRYGRATHRHDGHDARPGARTVRRAHARIVISAADIVRESRDASRMSRPERKLFFYVITPAHAIVDRSVEAYQAHVRRQAEKRVRAAHASCGRKRGRPGEEERVPRRSSIATDGRPET